MTESPATMPERSSGRVNLDLTDDEAKVLVRLLKHAIDSDPFPRAPRLRPLKAILDKLDPPAPQPEPPPPLRAGLVPDRKRGRWRR